MTKDDSVLKGMGQLKKDLRRIVKKWVTPMGLNWWDLDINYIYGDGPAQGKGRSGVASTRVNWEYKLATIDFYMANLIGRNLEQLEETVVHEMVHIPLSIMQMDINDEDYQKLVELTVTLITEAILWVREFAEKGKLSAEAITGKTSK